MELLAFISSCSLLLLSLPATNGVLFSSLSKSFQVTATMNATNGVLHAGEDNLFVSWMWNASSGGSDAAFKTVKSKLCFAPPSQVDRAWRSTKPDLKDDKTCPYLIAEQPYTRAGNSTMYRIERTIPGAMYFVRVYAFDQNKEVAYGQTTNANKTSNIFTVVGISGRPKSLVIATVCFSLFSVGSLITFFVIERKILAQKKAK